MINVSDHAALTEVVKFFEEIAAIPHGSSNTAGIAEYLTDFAKVRGLEYYRDEANNVIIKKPATAGYADRPTVILQGHTDMVCEKRLDVKKDMEREGLTLYRDGDFLRAEGTTLGGDDGIAVAYALALLDSSTIPHPAIEAVFTSDEEIGLLGAVALDTSRLEGRLMINIDSDEEGIFTVGCAGGIRTDATFAVARTDAGANCYRLGLSGLFGGHSGIEIDRGRENAIKVLGEMLGTLKNMRLVSLCGGNADNAIPRDCEAVFTVEEELGAEARGALDAVIAKISKAEPNAAYKLEPATASSALTEEDTARVMKLILGLPTGVVAMSCDVQGLVETSLNMGIARLEEKEFALSHSIRSAKAKSKDALVDQLKQFCAGIGVNFATRGGYPAWEYRKDSHLRDVMCRVYEQMYGKSAKVVIIHAGLECGIFSDKIEGLDCVSIGPDNHDIHTPDERLSLSSAERVWEYLCKTLISV